MHVVFRFARSFTLCKLFYLQILFYLQSIFVRCRQSKYYFHPHFIEKKLMFMEVKIALAKFGAETKSKPYY